MVGAARKLGSLVLVLAGCVFDSSGIGSRDALATDAPPDAAPDRLADQALESPAHEPSPDAFIEPPAGTIYALPTAKAIAIDGALDEWSATGWVSIGPSNWQNLTGVPPPTAADVSARLAARWSAGALYLAIEVTDDNHWNSAVTEDLLWTGDSLQLGFDGALNKGTTYDTTDDYEYGFAITNAPIQLAYAWTLPVGAPGLAGEYLVARSGQQTIYEIKLLPADVGQTGFSAGMTVGFAFMVNEDDGEGREGYLEWMSGLGAGKNPSLFGLLTLVP